MSIDIDMKLISNRDNKVVSYLCGNTLTSLLSSIKSAQHDINKVLTHTIDKQAARKEKGLDADDSSEFSDDDGTLDDIIPSSNKRLKKDNV